MVKACRTLRDKLANQKVTGALDGLVIGVYKGLSINYLGSCASGLFRFFLEYYSRKGDPNQQRDLSYDHVMDWGIFKNHHLLLRLGQTSIQFPKRTEEHIRRHLIL